uniref:Uncharacterized protein n=1 Tax=Rhizophora mucronata TaxID=61149 RepID=A0A2P2NJ03_RHIMU
MVGLAHASRVRVSLGQGQLNARLSFHFLSVSLLLRIGKGTLLSLVSVGIMAIPSFCLGFLQLTINHYYCSCFETVYLFVSWNLDPYAKGFLMFESVLLLA